MTSDHPVQVEVVSPVVFARPQLLVRLLLAIALGLVGITAGWLGCLLYVVLPAIAAIAISSSGATFANGINDRLWRALVWLLQLWAFMALLVDRFPAERDHPVRIDIRFTGTPTVGAALSRLATSIPSGLVLAVLWFASGILVFVALLVVLVGVPMPASLLAFQRAVLRWNARLVAYHASLVAEYPPFVLDTGDRHTPALATSAAPR
jgi:hypothetical protein